MKYCAFLRGVNVKGTAMKMAEVCAVFEKENLQNVSSVLATGNLLFSSDLGKENLKKNLEKTLSKHFDYEAFLFLKTKEEVQKIIENNPFTPSENSHIYVFVTEENVENLLLEEFMKSEKPTNEKAEIIEHTFYWQVEKGNTVDSDFGKILGKKSFKDKITSRNINTLEKILKKFN